MHIEKSKEEHHSLTILSAQWLQRLGAGFLVGNAVALGVSLTFPEWYESKLSRPVMGLNATFAMLGVREAQGIRRGRLNAGGIQERGKQPVFLDRIVPENEQELEKIRKTVQVVDRVGIDPERIEDELKRGRRIEDELNTKVAERNTAIAELNRVNRELAARDKELQDLKVGTPAPTPTPPPEEDPIYVKLSALGRVV